MKTLDKKTVSGYVMFICGFILVLISAMNYIFHWQLGSPPAAIGIVFVGIGASWVKKTKQSSIDKKGIRY
ncbi:MAG: hypothetical protein WCR42_14340 [bacterium]